MCFESNVNYAERLLIDKDVSGMSWIHLPSKKYKRIKSSKHISSCPNELEIDVNDMISISPNDKRFVDLAPMRIMSFDIECHSYGKLPLSD